MLSYFENKKDIESVENIVKSLNKGESDPTQEVIFKIESLKGLEYIAKNPLKENQSLMAARDDLFIELGKSSSKMMEALKKIIEVDINAICASRIFSSLEHSDEVSFSDFEDLELMYSLGYRRFMLSDNICNYSFDLAIKAWEEFINA